MPADARRTNGQQTNNHHPHHYARPGLALARTSTSKETTWNHHKADPATVNRDRRLWLVEAIVREREGFGRGTTVKRLSDELWRQRREAVRHGWPDAITFRDALNRTA